MLYIVPSVSSGVVGVRQGLTKSMQCIVPSERREVDLIFEMGETKHKYLLYPVWKSRVFDRRPD